MVSTEKSDNKISKLQKDIKEIQSYINFINEAKENAIKKGSWKKVCRFLCCYNWYTTDDEPGWELGINNYRLFPQKRGMTLMELLNECDENYTLFCIDKSGVKSVAHININDDIQVVAFREEASYWNSHSFCENFTRPDGSRFEAEIK